MNDFWNRAARTNAEIDRAAMAYEQRLRAEQQAVSDSLTPVFAEHQDSTQAWIDVARAKADRNRAATASSVGAGYVNLTDMRARSHDLAVQRYNNHTRHTDPAAYLAQTMTGDQAQGTSSGAPVSRFTDII
ncbi:hypothetical protein [Streptomyces sp. IMTB 1903]|uniref:hypothetical protein n=1 Tax=Streptomyces sp. IMTB 1903 TaxID=1776680 RepID=UPI000751C02D|nr:hypothetical protein [Streptomyces sp. IMTB 1903]